MKLKAPIIQISGWKSRISYGYEMKNIKHTGTTFKLYHHSTFETHGKLDPGTGHGYI